MGRQAHLARLALGRSPYEAPLLDEDGEFILGPNVQHDTAKDYIQEFDSRGHPQNLESELYRKRLIRAQNDALSTVGVVVRKAKRSRTSWQKMTEDQKHHLLLDENVAGANYGLVEDLVQRVATRWVIVFRRRLLVSFSCLIEPSFDLYRHLSHILGCLSPVCCSRSGRPMASEHFYLLAIQWLPSRVSALR